jgi:RNA-directed DNA polymerase
VSLVNRNGTRRVRTSGFSTTEKPVASAASDWYVIICRTKRTAQANCPSSLPSSHADHNQTQTHATPDKNPDCGYGTSSLRVPGLPFPQAHIQTNTHALALYVAKPKAMKTVRKKLHDITVRKRLSNPFSEVVMYLNRVIRGWRGYFRIGNSSLRFQQVDRYVRGRLRQWVQSQKGARGH